jgi:nitroimidazol reductase NimA-like FMN-containing flavoprotein (pyridoxamine 5'-phosphate oxidase superfamily)
MTAQNPHRPHTFQELDVPECLSLLGSHAVGRVAFTTTEGIQVLPVNHVLHNGDVYFRTSPYAAIIERLQHSQEVSFEVDDFDEYLRAGWSVLIVGVAEPIDPHEALVSLPSTEHPEPWAAGSRTLTVRIHPHRITGRRVLPG